MDESTTTIDDTTTDTTSATTDGDVPTTKDNRFATKIDIPAEDEVTPYSHGIDPQQVDIIIQKKKEIESRINNGGEAVTLEEFKEVIIPWNRIHRTSEFILKRPKEKAPKPPKPPKPPKEPRAPRVPKEPKPPKEKKLTKKEIEKFLNSAIVKMATGQTLTEQEQQVFDEHANVQIR